MKAKAWAAISLAALGAAGLPAGLVEVIPWEQGAPPVEQIEQGSRDRPSISDEDLRFQNRQVVVQPQSSAGPDFGYFNEWYRQCGSPRMAVMWNRSFITEDEEFQADSRDVVEHEGESASATYDSDGLQSEHYNEHRERTTGQHEERIANDNDLGDREIMRLQEAFSRPLRDAGVILVDSSAATRLQQLDNSRGWQRPSQRDRGVTETEAIVNRAEYLIELQATAGARASQPYTLQARVIDLADGSVVATVNSDTVAAPLRIPGAGPPRPVSLEQSAETLALALLDEFPRSL